jgi:hypothetical protein
MKRQTLPDFTYMRYLGESNLYKVEWCFPGAGSGESYGKLVFNGYRVSILQARVLEVDGVDGYTAM